jgi:uncharacterized protein (TIGR03000 family)
MKALYVSLGLLLAGFAHSISAQDEKKAPTEKAPATIIVLVQESNYKPTIVKIEGVPTKQKGAKREFTTPPLEPGKNYVYQIECLVEPNNYTKISRPREVTFKAGETVVVDLTKEDKKLDKIVVRWVPTPDDIVDKMSEMAKVTKEDIVYDLGCGDAVMLIRPIKNSGAKKGVGIEIDPKIVEKAKENVKNAGLTDKIDIRQGDILDVKDMGDATVVLLYIGDDLGARLSPVLKKSLKPGARIVSHRFKLGDWEPTKSIKVMGADGDEYELHLWEVK